MEGCWTGERGGEGGREGTAEMAGGGGGED